MTAFSALGEHSVSPEMRGFSGVIPLYGVSGLKRRTLLLEDSPPGPRSQHQRTHSNDCMEETHLPAFASEMAKRNLKNECD